MDFCYHLKIHSCQSMCKIYRLTFFTSYVALSSNSFYFGCFITSDSSVFICTVFHSLCLKCLFTVEPFVHVFFFWEVSLFIFRLFWFVVKTTIVQHISTPSGWKFFFSSSTLKTTNCSLLVSFDFLCVVIHSFTKINTFMTF